jgi:hypothetical protein
LVVPGDRLVEGRQRLGADREHESVVAEALAGREPNALVLGVDVLDPRRYERAPSPRTAAGKLTRRTRPTLNGCSMPSGR